MAKMNEQLARGGMLVSLLTVFLFLARLRFFRLSALVATSIVMVAALIMLGFKQSLYVYLVTAVIAIVFFPSSSSLMFLVFFGSYPLLKAWLENQPRLSSVLWPTKLTYFAVIFFLARYVLWYILFGGWGFVSRVSILAIPLAIVFDLALSLLAPYIESTLKNYRLR